MYLLQQISRATTTTKQSLPLSDRAAVDVILFGHFHTVRPPLKTRSSHEYVVISCSNYYFLSLRSTSRNTLKLIYLVYNLLALLEHFTGCPRGCIGRRKNWPEDELQERIKVAPGVNSRESRPECLQNCLLQLTARKNDSIVKSTCHSFRFQQLRLYYSICF